MRRGFTLIELLLVIGIMAILASIVVIAINPTRQLASGRDAKRQSDTNTILNGVYQYLIDKGNLPNGIPTGAARGICKTGAVSCNNGVDLSVLTGSYLVSMPIDPKAVSTGTGTEYYIRRDTGGRLTVSAPLTEVKTTPISVTR